MRGHMGLCTNMHKSGFGQQLNALRLKLPDHESDNLSISCSLLDLERETKPLPWGTGKSRPRVSQCWDLSRRALFWAPIQVSHCLQAARFAEHRHIFSRRALHKSCFSFSVWQTGCPNTAASPALALHRVGKRPLASRCYDAGENVAVSEVWPSWLPNKTNDSDTNKQGEHILSHKTNTLGAKFSKNLKPTFWINSSYLLCISILLP